MDGATFRQDVDPQMTSEENQQSQVDSLWEQNEPMARQMYFTYMLSRTPSELYDLMVTKIGANLPGGLPDGSAAIADGDPVPVWASPSGLVLAGSPAVAVIANEAVARVDLPVPTTRGFVNDGQSVAVRDGATPLPGSPGSIAVANHAISAVNLTIPATTAFIADGAAVNMIDQTDAPIAGYTATAVVQNKALAAVKLVPIT